MTESSSNNRTLNAGFSNMHYPMLIDLSDKKVVIFGAGKVAERKALSLLNAQQVKMVGSQFSEKIIAAAKDTDCLTLITTNLTTISDSNLAEQMVDCFMIIPATSDKIFNNKVSEIANLSGVLVNRIDEVGEVIFPAIVQQGDITLTISTNGKSPALSKYIKAKLLDTINPQYAQMALLQAEIRDLLKDIIDDQAIRKNILWNIMNSEQIWQALNDNLDDAINLSRELIDKTLKGDRT